MEVLLCIWYYGMTMHHRKIEKPKNQEILENSLTLKIQKRTQNIQTK